MPKKRSQLRHASVCNRARKHIYDSEESACVGAERAKVRSGDDNIRAYECTRGHWHIGHDNSRPFKPAPTIEKRNEHSLNRLGRIAGDIWKGLGDTNAEETADS